MKTNQKKKKRPRAEIVLDKAERTLIRLGLDLIVKRLATAKAGYFPNGHPLARINPPRATIYQTRAYNEEFAAKLISLRNRVSPVRREKEFKLDAFDLAAAALALRVTRQKRLWEETSDVYKRHLRKLSDPPEQEITTLLRKLENARKRAKPTRSAGALQHKRYTGRRTKWKAFVAWMRYSLLYDDDQIQRIIKRGIGMPGARRTVARLRLQVLLNAASTVIRERTTAQISTIGAAAPREARQE